ncbi:hypothetical protein [Lacipirellula sp.]|uniref:hypothetical protein n=1 Tax=Lacipirellula sp. TaxID=2691419 RepID=UPI003D0F2E70
MEERTLNILIALAFIASIAALGRLVGVSISVKRFSVRDGLHAMAIVAVMAAILAAATWMK